MEKIFLNVGCGPRFYRGKPWVNLDVVSTDAMVTRWDVRAGFPVEANTVDGVYLSHVLEHFSEEEGAQLIAECHRVLKIGGVVRVVVPDLEGICREYLRQLDEIRSTPPGSASRLAWIKLELLDQCTRHESGGRMKTFFRDHGREALDYVVSRIGTVGIQLAQANTPSAERKKARRHERSEPFQGVWAVVRVWFRNMLFSAEKAEALRIGQFRTGGEVHLCMYDSVAMEQVFKDQGFEEIEFVNAQTSHIPDWTRYHLDLDSDGREHAPHSLYVEGKKRSL